MTPNRLEQLIHDIIEKRIIDGQLDECDLTMREIRAIAENFAYTLTNMLHSRIAYPTETASRSRNLSVFRRTPRPFPLRSISAFEWPRLAPFTSSIASVCPLRFSMAAPICAGCAGSMLGEGIVHGRCAGIDRGNRGQLCLRPRHRRSPSAIHEHSRPDRCHHLRARRDHY